VPPYIANSNYVIQVNDDILQDFLLSNFASKMMTISIILCTYCIRTFKYITHWKSF